jgi:hypothetical protein
MLQCRIVTKHHRLESPMKLPHNADEGAWIQPLAPSLYYKRYYGMMNYTRRIITDAFVPPKPKLFDKAISIFFSFATFGVKSIP